MMLDNVLMADSIWHFPWYDPPTMKSVFCKLNVLNCCQSEIKIFVSQLGDPVARGRSSLNGWFPLTVCTCVVVINIKRCESETDIAVLVECLVIVLAECLWCIACHDGLLAWWDGLLPSLVLVFNPAINFMAYEALKRNILPTLVVWVRQVHCCTLWCFHYAVSELFITSVLSDLLFVEHFVEIAQDVLLEMVGTKLEFGQCFQLYTCLQDGLTGLLFSHYSIIKNRTN